MSSHQRGRVVDVAAAVEVIGGRAEANGDRVGRVDPRIVPGAIRVPVPWEISAGRGKAIGS